MSMQFIVPQDAPCVNGHFPDSPIVPGAFLLGQIHQACRQRYPEYSLMAIKKAKFLAPVLPGYRVDIAIDEGAWPRLQFSLLVNNAPVLEASGQLSARVAQG